MAQSQSGTTTPGSPDPVDALGPTGICAGTYRGGSLTTQPVVPAVPIILSPGLARLRARPRSTWRPTSWGMSKCQANVGVRTSPAPLTRRWSSKAILMRSGCSRGSICWVLLVWVGFLFQKPLSPKQRTLAHPLSTQPESSFRWTGVKGQVTDCAMPYLNRRKDAPGT